VTQKGEEKKIPNQSSNHLITCTRRMKLWYYTLSWSQDHLIALRIQSTLLVSIIHTS